jgi:hypothetical protein
VRRGVCRRGYIKAKLSVALEVLSDTKHVLKEDAGVDLNFDKTRILVKGISAADAHVEAQRMLNADPSLAHLSPPLSPASFVVDGYIGLGVPIGTDAFIQHFVKDKCQAIMADVDKLDNIQEGFIHYQLLPASAKRPGCNILTGTYSSRAKTCSSSTLTKRLPTPS